MKRLSYVCLRRDGKGDYPLSLWMIGFWFLGEVRGRRYSVLLQVYFVFWKEGCGGIFSNWGLFFDRGRGLGMYPCFPSISD